MNTLESFTCGKSNKDSVSKVNIECLKIKACGTMKRGKYYNLCTWRDSKDFAGYTIMGPWDDFNAASEWAMESAKKKGFIVVKTV